MNDGESFDQSGTIFPDAPNKTEHNEVADSKRSLLIGFDDPNYNIAKIDSGGNLITRDWIDAGIEAGKVYIINENATLNNGESLLVSFLSGSIADVIFLFKSDAGAATWEITEDGTPTGGTAVPILNPNLITPVAVNASALRDPVIAGDSLLLNGEIGSGQGGSAEGGEAGSPPRVIMPTAKRFNLEIGSLANGNECTIGISFLER